MKTIINLRATWNAGNFFTAEEILPSEEGLRYMDLIN
jgi:hypothetical protein